MEPSFEGAFAPRNLAPDFLPALAARVEAGEISGSGSGGRFRVEVLTERSLRFRTLGLWTTVRVGLGKVELRLPQGGGAVEYSVSFRAWAAWRLLLSLGVSAAVGATRLLWAPAVWERLLGEVPAGLGEPALWLGLGSFGLGWPVLLVLLHRRGIHEDFLRVLEEVNAAALGPSPGPDG
jgi:hypothetical protein